MIDIKVSELTQGDVFLFGDVKFEVVLPVVPMETDLALCRITNQCANLYISAHAWVKHVKEISQHSDQC